MCSIDGCKKPYRAAGFCNTHYEQKRRTGTPIPTRNHAPFGASQQFIETAADYKGDDCIFWPFGKNSAGYAHINSSEGTRLVHRQICEKINGLPPTPDHKAAHSCGNGHLACIAPKHLIWKTHADNMVDMIVHRRSQLGCKNIKAKLTYEQVVEIKRLAGLFSARKRACIFGVSSSTINRIDCGVTYRDVK
jgi:hypothetical protein